MTATPELDAYLAGLHGRCREMYDLATQHVPGFHECPESPRTEADDWSTFVTALKSVVRNDGTVHACDLRPILRGRIERHRLSSFYRKARASGAQQLLEEVGTERSDDHAGRNAGRHEPYYLLRSAA